MKRNNVLLLEVIRLKEQDYQAVQNITGQQQMIIKQNNFWGKISQILSFACLFNMGEGWLRWKVARTLLIGINRSHCCCWYIKAYFDSASFITLFIDNEHSMSIRIYSRSIPLILGLKWHISTCIVSKHCDFLLTISPRVMSWRRAS